MSKKEQSGSLEITLDGQSKKTITPTLKLEGRVKDMLEALKDDLGVSYKRLFHTLFVTNGDQISTVLSKKDYAHDDSTEFVRKSFALSEDTVGALDSFADEHSLSRSDVVNRFVVIVVDDFNRQKKEIQKAIEADKPKLKKMKEILFTMNANVLRDEFEEFAMLEDAIYELSAKLEV